MKKGFLLLLLTASVFAQGQSLKEALFGGKLKNDPGTVIRKGDDLSTKMPDTTRKTATADSAKTKAIALSNDSAAKKLVAPADSAFVAGTANGDSLSVTPVTATAEIASATKEVTAAPKDNNALWKTHVDTVVSVLKSEVLTSKKIKKGTYYVTVSYAIETNGEVAVTDVFTAPESDFLQQQVKDRLNVDTPRLNPVLNSAGTPRRVTRKYNFTLVKE